MNTIWYRKSFESEVIGRCGGDEKTNDHAELRSRTLKNLKQTITLAPKFAFVCEENRITRGNSPVRLGDHMTISHAEGLIL